MRRQIEVTSVDNRISRLAEMINECEKMNGTIL